MTYKKKRYKKPQRRANTAKTLENKTRSIQASWRHATDNTESLAIEQARTLIRQASDGQIVCRYCRQTVQPLDLSVDHKQPRSRGGSSAPDNLCWVHRDCNLQKGSLTEDEFKQLMEVFNGWEPAGRDNVLRRLKAGGMMFARRRGRR